MDNIEKLIYNELLSRGGILLPEVGTLSVTLVSAHITDKGTIAPPVRQVRFSQNVDNRYRTVGECMAATAQMDVEQAEKLYVRQLTKWRNNGTLSIEGVGRIKNNFFYPDTLFDAALNPEGFETLPLPVKRKKWWIWPIVVVAAGMIGAAVWYVVDSGLLAGKQPQTTVSSKEVNTPAAEPTNEVKSDKAQTADEESNQPLPDNRQTESQSESDTQSESNKPRKPDSNQTSDTTVANEAAKQYCVVVGVFTTRQNAEKYIRQDKFKIGADNYAIYPFKGEKFMVGAYPTADRSQADQSRRKLSSRDNGVWVTQVDQQ